MKARYMVSCAVAALVSGGTAFAQTAPANGIEQVVVTAERRS